MNFSEERDKKLMINIVFTESKYGISGTITTRWLLGGTMVVVPRDLSRDLWAWPRRSHDPRRSHETCHVTCGCGPAEVP